MSRDNNQFVLVPDDSRIAMADVAAGVMEAHGAGDLRSVVDLVVYTGLLMERSVEEVARFLRVSASEVYALERRAKVRMIGEGTDQGTYLRGLVGSVRRAAEREGRWREPASSEAQEALIRSRQQGRRSEARMSAFGARLFERRAAMGLNRVAAARVMGVSEWVVRALEQGGRAVRPDRFEAVCLWLGVDVTEGVRLLESDGVVQVGSGGGRDAELAYG